jgi:hypothetical protein
MDFGTLKKLIFSISDEHSFEDAALRVFRFQAINNAVYREYINALKCEVSSINGVSMIPFLPIDFFKGQTVLSNESGYEIVFTSSGTTNTQPSKHYVSDVLLYRESFMRTFKQFYGPPSDYAILALLPSYLEREGSSLVYMVDCLINESKNPDSGFYLDNHDQLIEKIKKLKNKKQKFMLWGVTFALLELAEKYDLDFGDGIVIETGGMKGRRAEPTREELHRNLCERFHLASIHSEYGMTELLSQAYSKGFGIFQAPPWMKIMIRDMNDPLVTISKHNVGGINVIDLANIHSCSFIATQDLGRLSYDSTFEVLGRFDNSDIRGCNLMIS